MPESPEVQRIVDQFNDKYKGKILIDSEIHDFKWKTKKKLLDLMTNSVLDQVSRKAKYIIFQFTSSIGTFYLTSHLSMSGSWINRLKSTLAPTHTRMSLRFENGVIDFIDPRKWGRIEIYTQEDFFKNEKLQAKFSNYGLDALTENITSEWLYQKIQLEKNKEIGIKPLLMDQNFIAGIGNIYASEICFLAGINPFKKIKNLTAENLQNLSESISEVIKNAYTYGGSTIRTYKDTNGEKGKTVHMIYGQKICRLCKSIVSKGPQNGRTTYWCNKCQPI